MKKALCKLLLFLLLFCLTDGLAGRLFAYMQSHAPSYLPGYIAHHANEDVIIFGSSKGGSNYNMKLLNDSLGLSCLNCADTGNGIIQMYGRYKMLTNRYTPKFIVYDVRPQFDLYKNDNSKYTMRLKPLYEEAGIDSIIWSVDNNERYKMFSALYRNNFQFLEIIKDYSSQASFNHSSEKLSRQKMSIIPKAIEPNIEEYDSLKLYYLETMIKDCKERGIHLVFVVSPEYYHYKSVNYEPLVSLCQQYNVPFIDRSEDEQYNENKDYFIDSLHMNYWGATMWSLFIVNYIQSHFTLN